MVSADKNEIDMFGQPNFDFIESSGKHEELAFLQKSERKEHNSIRIRREELLISLNNLNTVPLKGDLNVKLSSDIFLIDNNPEHPDKPSSECPISKEDFANNEDVIIFNRAKHGFKQMYKITSLQAWIDHKPIAPTDPTTREPITKQNVERYTLKFIQMFYVLFINKT